MAEFTKLARRTAVVIALAVGVITPGVRAASYCWDGNPATGSINSTSEGGDGAWNTTDVVWDIGGAVRAAWASGNTAVFGGGGAVTLGTAISALNLQLAGSGYTITPSATNTLTLTAINGTAGSSANAIYASGTTNTVGGTIILAGSATANTTNYLTAASGATLNLAGSVTQNNTSASGTTIYGPGAINFSGSGTFATGKFNVQGGATFTSSGNMSGFTQTYAGVSDALSPMWNITGGTVAGGGTALFIGNGGGTSGALAVSGSSAVTFTGAFNVGNTFDNGTSRNGDGFGTASLADTATLTVGGIRLGNAKGGRGTFDLNGGTLTTSGITLGVSTGGTGTGGFGVVNFNGGVLRASAGSAAFVDASLTTANVRNGGVIIDSNTFDVVVSKPLVHSTIMGDAATDGGLTKRSGGVLTLNAANTYTGNTSIEGGSVYLGAAGTLGTTAGTVTIGSGTTLATNTSANVTIGNVLAGSGTFSKLSSGVTTLSAANMWTGPVVLPNAVAAIGAIRLANSQALGPDGTAKTINLDASTGVATGGIELTNDITVVNKLIRFGGRSLAPANAALVNVSGNNAWNGNLEIRGGGGGYPLRSDAGTLTLSGAVTNEVAGGARGFTLYGNGDYSITGLVRDGTTATATTSLAMSGAGKATLAGTNTYTGGTTISGGTLVAGTGALSGSQSNTGTGPVAVNGGGTLAGKGRITGAVNVNAGGVITAGGGAAATDSVGTLTNTGTQTWTGSGTTEAAGGTYTWKVGSAGITDKLEIGLLNLVATSGNKFTLRPLNAGGTFALSTTYLLAHVSGLQLNSVAQTGSAPIGLTNLFYLDLTGIGVTDNDSRFAIGAVSDGLGGNGFNLQLQATPEPASTLLVSMAGTTLLGLRRRNRR